MDCSIKTRLSRTRGANPNTEYHTSYASGLSRARRRGAGRARLAGLSPLPRDGSHRRKAPKRQTCPGARGRTDVSS